MSSKRFNRLEIILVVMGVLTLIIAVTSVIFALRFLSQNLLQALSISPEGIKAPVDFDIEGYNRLNL